MYPPERPPPPNRAAPISPRSGVHSSGGSPWIPLPPGLHQAGGLPLHPPGGIPRGFPLHPPGDSPFTPRGIPQGIPPLPPGDSPPLPPPQRDSPGDSPFAPSPEGCPSRAGGPCGGFPDAEQGVDLCFSFKSHLSPQVLAQESLATGVTGVMVPAGTVTQPLLIPISIAGQVTGQQALALVTIPTATLAALPGLTPAAPAGAIFKPPVANLTGNRR